MQTSFCLALNGYSQHSRGFSSWWLWRSGHLHTRQYITWGSPFLWDTWRRPSSDLGIVTHLLDWPGLLRAFSRSSKAPLFFFSFFTNESTAFSAHFSSSSPCFQPRSLLTAGLVKENRLFRLDIGELISLLSPVKEEYLHKLYCQTNYFYGYKINFHKMLWFYTRCFLTPTQILRW